jgi:magnesium chelatase subunit I
MTQHPVPPPDLPRTLGELKRRQWRIDPVKDELRRNLKERLRTGAPVFSGIVGYETTVVPQVCAAILARHDFLLLGLRGQAKTRLIRQMVHLLDEWMPVIEGSPINESPYDPLTKRSRELVSDLGDSTPIGWVHRSRRYQEKLATPDVAIADLIGDIDPIKAVAKKLDFSDEEVIHYGLIPRSNRGIFAINELPDLQARIQVGLLNIMEEKDFQIRGFPVRLPLDVALVFTANPEDYTNRGNIITPLKDRINAQILTHYPESISDAQAITKQEAWTDRDTGVRIAPLIHELAERVVFEARKSDFVDKASGVSARASIAYIETICSIAEARALRSGEAQGHARIGDLFEAIPALTGKLELVYKGEQEGVTNVAFHLIGRAIKEAFNTRYIAVKKEARGKERPDFSRFQPIVEWFEAGHALVLGTALPQAEHDKALAAIPGLVELAHELSRGDDTADPMLTAEFIIEGLNQNMLLTKQIVDARVRYTDAVSYMMNEVSE